MKKRNFLALLLAGSLFSVSCNKWIDTSLNTDPNNPSEVAIKNLFPTSVATLGFTLGSDPNRITSLWTQHNQGIDRQHAGYYQYIFNESNSSTTWDNFYSVPMANLYNVINKATANKSYHVRGAARILMATALGNVTDLWGDVPYSGAFQGTGNLKPKFQSQQEIYGIIQGLLDSAIADLGQASSSTPLNDGNMDIVYSGDKNKWIKAAHSLKARYYIHLSKRDAQAADKALAELQKGISSNAEDANCPFGTDAKNSNPLFTFMQDRGDILPADYFVNLLKDNADPRLEKLIVLDGTDVAGIGDAVAGATAPISFMTFAESKFIEAEIYTRKGDQTAAKAALTAAIQASMDKLGVSATDATAYITKTIPSGDVTLDLVMTQKYIALYTYLETWTDWRRTGFPNVPATSGFQQSDIPRRWPYPQSERLFNSENFPGVKKLTDRVWWDAQ